MNEIFEAAAEIHQFCADSRWKFCFIGAVAVARWGEPRATQDVDLTILTGFGAESTYIDALLERFPARISEAKAFALKKRVLLLNTSRGVPVDVALGAIPYEERIIDRSSNWLISRNVALRTCSAEDVVITKAVADRDGDWKDIRRVIVRRPKLDRALIFRELTPLLELKEDMAPAERLRKLFEQLG